MLRVVTSTKDNMLVWQWDGERVVYDKYIGWIEEQSRITLLCVRYVSIDIHE